MSECKKCESCRWYEWDFIKEVMYCDNPASELYELEGEDNDCCEEWEARVPIPAITSK